MKMEKFPVSSVFLTVSFFIQWEVVLLMKVIRIIPYTVKIYFLAFIFLLDCHFIHMVSPRLTDMCESDSEMKVEKPKSR